MCSLQRCLFILLGTFTLIQGVRALARGSRLDVTSCVVSTYQLTNCGYRKDAGIYTHKVEGVTEGKRVNVGELIRSPSLLTNQGWPRVDVHALT